MDSSINPSITPSSSTSTDAAMVPFNRDTFMATYIPRQEWSLPDSIIYYISKNPSSAKVYGKLIQSCKYFLIRNPRIVVKDLYLTQYNNHIMEVAFDGELVDLNTIPSNIWPTDKLSVLSISNPNKQNSLSILIPKICHCNIKELNLLKQICSFNDLKFLGSKCEDVTIIETVVMNENDEIVAFEDVFQLFPHVKDLTFHFDNQSSMMMNPKTFQKLVKTPHFLNLQNLRLYALSERFDLNGFYAYMKINKKTNIFLHFCNELSDVYCNRLQAVVDEIVGDESHDYNPPYITFPGLDESLYDLMWNLWDQE